VDLEIKVLGGANAEKILTNGEASRLIAYLHKAVSMAELAKSLTQQVLGPDGERFKFFAPYDICKNYSNARYLELFQEIEEVAMTYGVLVTSYERSSSVNITFEPPCYVDTHGRQYVEDSTIFEEEANRNIKWRKWQNLGILLLNSMKKAAERKALERDLWIRKGKGESSSAVNAEIKAGIRSLFVVVQ